MTKNIRRKIMTCAFLLLAVSSLFLETCCVYAAEGQTKRQEAVNNAQIQVTFPQIGGTAMIEEKNSGSSVYPSPAIKNDQVTVADGQTGVFELGYDEPGTYEYTVRQVTDKKDAGIIYDDSAYDVTLFIASKDDGTLYHEISVFKNGSIKKTDKLIFENRKKEEKKEKTSSGGSGGKGGRTKTGDTKNLVMWAKVTAASAFFLSVMLLLRRRNAGRK